MTSLKKRGSGLRRTLPERISTAFRRCGGAVTVLEMGPSWLWDSPTAPPAQRSLGDAKKNGRVFRHHNWSQTRPNCCGDAPTCRAGRRRGRVYVSCRMKNPLECHLPTRMPKMILVFYASLAPRGYGRTSPRPSRVFLPFVANLARVVAPRHYDALIIWNTSR